jgi:hypothetical protein
MKPILLPLSLLLTLCALASAQERVVVPARSTPGPREVQTHLVHGSITVKAYSGKEIIVEMDGSSSRRAPAASGGMRRIDVPRGLDIDADDNTVNIHVRAGTPRSLTITVPTDTTLHLKTLNGDITVEGVNGEIEVNTLNGRFRLDDVSGNVLANSQNGSIAVTMARTDRNKPLSFTSFNGPIDVTLPADTKANLKMRTDRGEIYSDFEVKLTSGGPVSQSNDAGGGRYRLTYDRTIYATINGGGPEISFRTFNGRIRLQKK